MRKSLAGSPVYWNVPEHTGKSSPCFHPRHANDSDCWTGRVGDLSRGRDDQKIINLSRKKQVRFSGLVFFVTDNDNTERHVP